MAENVRGCAIHVYARREYIILSFKRDTRGEGTTGTILRMIIRGKKKKSIFPSTYSPLRPLTGITMARGQDVLPTISAAPRLSKPATISYRPIGRLGESNVARTAYDRYSDIVIFKNQRTITGRRRVSDGAPKEVDFGSGSLPPPIGTSYNFFFSRSQFVRFYIFTHNYNFMK